MGAKPGKIEREIRVPSGEREVPIGTVSAGETWSFSAAGEWSTGFVRCGPDGYRNFLYDALNFEPRAPGEARLKLMCRFKDEPNSAAFPIGAGCTKTFTRSGELVVFGNDRPEGYADNRGAVTLTAVRGGVAPGPAHAIGGLSGWWRDVVDIFRRTAGVPVIAAFALGVSGILLFMPQGRDLVRGVGEDGFGRIGDRLRNRGSVLRNSGLELVAHRHRLELRNQPRALAAALAPGMGAEGAGLPAFRRGRDRAHGQFRVERARRLDPAGDRSALVRAFGRAEADDESNGGRYSDGAVASGRLGHRRPRHGAGRHGRRGPLARRNRRRARRPGDRFLRARFHHSRDHDRLPARHEPQDPGRRRAPPVGGSYRGVLRQSPGRAARPRRRNGRLDRTSDFGERVQTMGGSPARRPQRQEDDGPRRRAGRRVASRVLDGRRALEPAGGRESKSR